MVYRDARFGRGSGPIFLDKVDCSGTESTLLQCGKFSPLGIHMCDHFQDVGIHCEG